jgi:hypothetical protein
MNRKLLVVPLILATGVVLADEGTEPKPETTPEVRAEPVSRVTGAHAKPEAGAAEAKARTEAGAIEAKAQTEKDAKLLSGMSVLGNREAPKSLVIVPWKSSEIGDSLGISTMLDDSRRPVDKEVFLRELRYYEIQHAGRGGAADAFEEASRK